MYRIFTLLILLSVLFSACNKDYAGSIDANYEGEWHSLDTFTTANGIQADIYFLIAPDKKSKYGFVCDVSPNCSPCECQLLTEGKAKINRSQTRLYIGSGNGNKKVKLEINESPHLNSNGKWECTIDNHVMIRN